MTRVRFFCQGGAHFDYLWHIHEGLSLHMGHSHCAKQTKIVGGVALNVALALRLLGEEVFLQGFGGKDSQEFLDYLGAWGLHQFHRDDSMTSENPEYHGIFSPNQEFLFAVVKSEAYRKLSTKTLDKLTPRDHYVVDSNLPTDFMLEAMKRPSFSKSLVFVSAVGTKNCHAYLHRLDHIFMNVEEARIFLEDAKASPEFLAKKLVTLGVKEAFVTLGKEGVVVANTQEVNHVPGNKAQATCVNGAGDTHAGMILALKNQGFSGVEAATRAQNLMPYYVQGGREGLRAEIMKSKESAYASL